MTQHKVALFVTCLVDMMRPRIGFAAIRALEAAGCKVNSFEPEDGKIEAKCTETATGKIWEIYIDPKTGAVSEVKADD